MLTRQKDNWGLGFGLETPGHTLRFGHDGANEGFRGDLEAYTESGQGTGHHDQFDSGNQLASEFLGAVAKEYNWPDFQPIERSVTKIAPAVLATYAGTYDAPGLSKVTVTAKDGKLYLQVDPFGPAPLELLPESDTSFSVCPLTSPCLSYSEGRKRDSHQTHHHRRPDVRGKKVR